MATRRCEDCGKKFRAMTGNEYLCPNCTEDMIDMMYPNGRDGDVENWDD